MQYYETCDKIKTELESRFNQAKLKPVSNLRKHLVGALSKQRRLQRTFGRAAKVLLWNWYRLWLTWAPALPRAWRSENYASRSIPGYASINSRGAHPPPPSEQPRGICSRCQAGGWGIRNFIAAWGLGISIPRGDPGIWHKCCLNQQSDVEFARSVDK